MSDQSLQREVTRIMLDISAKHGFALAGSGAVREHGLISRPTNDADLFTTFDHLPQFREAVDHAIDELRIRGYKVDIDPGHNNNVMVRLIVSANSASTEIDMAINSREELPVLMEIGPVLSEMDAVAFKTLAIFDRVELRDFLDLDSIRRSGRYSDNELLREAKIRDNGFDQEIFAYQLLEAKRFPAGSAQEYGITDSEFEGARTRLAAWAADILNQNVPEDGGPAIL